MSVDLKGSSVKMISFAANNSKVPGSLNRVNSNTTCCMATLEHSATKPRNCSVKDTLTKTKSPTASGTLRGVRATGMKVSSRVG
jgi:hypothetical protein